MYWWNAGGGGGGIFLQGSRTALPLLGQADKDKNAYSPGGKGE
jgi:hypothetical protein